MRLYTQLLGSAALVGLGLLCACDSDEDGSAGAAEADATSGPDVSLPTPTDSGDPGPGSDGTTGGSDPDDRGSTGDGGQAEGGGVGDDGSTPDLCDAGEAMCGEDCVDLDSDVDHCGACDAACEPVQGAQVTCDGGCVYACLPTRGDCDDAAPGCEADLEQPEHCGTCDHVCNAGDTCELGRCITVQNRVVDGGFGEGLTYWTAANNPIHAIDDVSSWTVEGGILKAVPSFGPTARVVYQDVEIPDGFRSVKLKFHVAQRPDTLLDPDNVSVIESDPYDASGDGKAQNAFRVDFVDPEQDVFYAPVEFEAYAPSGEVGNVGDNLDAVEVSGFLFRSFIGQRTGETVRLRIAQVESDTSWPVEIDNVRLLFEFEY